MRNLNRHPLTQHEIAKACRDQAEALRTENKIGDVRPMALERAAKIVEDAAKLLDGVQTIP